jgi:hypothetical protein
MSGTIYSGFGYWNALFWLFFFVVAAAFAFYFRWFGRNDYRKGTSQDEIYYSGNAVPQGGADVSVPASAAYWGFKRACAPLYAWLDRVHSGNGADYMGYFLLTFVLISLSMLLF